jgi:hypothetical protein
LAVEHDIVPFDWADVFQQAWRAGRTGEDSGDFPPLPVNDAGQDQVQAAAEVREFRNGAASLAEDFGMRHGNGIAKNTNSAGPPSLSRSQIQAEP